MLAVYAWAMALGYSSIHFVQDSERPLSHQWYQLDDLADTFHHTVPSTYSDHTTDADEYDRYPTLDNHFASGHRRDMLPIIGCTKTGVLKAPNSLINKNKAALLYPFHFFF
ncbi:MAG: hypothetical protein CMH46_10255 [Muricauda sp.]|nr:hypothetical protein [Allomuricauda sp.]|tara:strand:- start:7784 stop:8116 length:333 start_codon:yes stop_codon:yes gene_type:complete